MSISGISSYSAYSKRVSFGAKPPRVRSLTAALREERTGEASNFKDPAPLLSPFKYPEPVNNFKTSNN